MKKLLLLVLLSAFLSGCSNNSNDIIRNDKEEIEQADIKTYVSKAGWSVNYPASWDRVEDTLLQETKSGKSIMIKTESITKEDLELWIEKEIERKVNSEEANVSLKESLKTEEEEEGIVKYSYRTKVEEADNPGGEIPTVIFYDGETMYNFFAVLPPVEEEEFNLIINSFQTNK